MATEPRRVDCVVFHRTTFRPASATRAPSGDTATLPDRPTVCELENTPANTSWRHPPPDQTVRSLAGYLGHPRTTLTDSHRGCPRTPDPSRSSRPIRVER